MAQLPTPLRSTKREYDPLQAEREVWDQYKGLLSLPDVEDRVLPPPGNPLTPMAARVADVLGLTDAYRAVRGGMTDNEARDFAFGATLGLFPMRRMASPLLNSITPKPTYTRIPTEAPASLRDRYWYELYQASGGKDVNRIKLTPERVSAAADNISKRNETPGIPDPYLYLPHGQRALEFATEAKRAGHDVQVKYPDGPMGSVYVRVGDRGTVRFADHAAPTEGGDVVGGYSSALRRRHGPATLSVAPGDNTFDDAMAWLSK
jgi:hypothetical protein